MNRNLVILTTTIFFFGCKKKEANETPQTYPAPNVDISATAVVVDVIMNPGNKITQSEFKYFSN